LNEQRDIKSLSDAELVNEYRRLGDNTYIGVLFERYSLFLVAVSMKYLKDEDEARDAAMQVFEKLLNDLKKHEITHFKSWLYSVVKNHCLMQLRSEKAHLNHEKNIKYEMGKVVELNSFLHPDHNKEKEMQLQKMEEGMKTLNEKQRKCIELFYLQEKCYEEVAKETGYSMNEVKSHIQNGKRNLKIYLLRALEKT
jgi:RNA polymerase sigma-70 factor (ECF subfamily)